MPSTPSIMRLHLRYRLWIAEMNSDITVLRIFDDYLAEIIKKNIASLQTTINDFQKQFVGFRKEIDELKHEMHLMKMKLAAHERDTEAGKDPQIVIENQQALKDRYDAFRDDFEIAKKMFLKLDSK